MDNKSLGKEGELIAVKFLENKGYKILDTNFHKRAGEIDIIAFDPSFGEYVFVEVKTRSNLSFGYPEESVDEDKIEKISETAEGWFEDKDIDDPEWRIDIIGIEWYGKEPKIDHIQNIS
jgi:putative endonuclease